MREAWDLANRTLVPRSMQRALLPQADLRPAGARRLAGIVATALAEALDTHADLSAQPQQSLRVMRRDNPALDQSIAHAIDRALDIPSEISPESSDFARIAAEELAWTLVVPRTPPLQAVGSLLDFYELVGSIVYGLVVFAVGEEAPNRAIAIGRGQLSATEDERIEFERVWSLVERAVDSGRLGRSVEDEIRALNAVLGVTRNQLDPERHADLFDLVSRKLVALLPEVIRSLLLTDWPVPAAIESVNNDEPLSSQLRALADDLGEAADELEGVAARITDTPDRAELPVPAPVPYGDAIIDRINQRFARLDATYAKLQTTRTGRLVLRNAGAGTATLAAGIGLATTDVVSGGAASVIAMVGSWIYTRIRRLRPDLPSRNRAVDPSAEV